MVVTPRTVETLGMNPDNQVEGRPLTSRQLLIWTEQQLAPDVPANNMLMCFTIEGNVDPNRFARAFERVVAEADALRTIVHERDGVPLQFIRPHAAPCVEIVDHSDDPDPENFHTWRDARCLKRFDLGEQLFDCALIRLGKNRSIWYFCQHHLICDAWSFALIFKRTAELYGELDADGAADGAAEARNRKSRSFWQYLDSEKNYRDSERHTVSEAFWKDRYSSPIESLHPYGVDPTGKRPATRRLSVGLGDTRSTKIRALALEERMRAATEALSLSMLFSTALYAYLHRISGNETIGIGSPVLNRPSRWSKQTIGLFMEVCPFQVQILEDDTFVSLHKKTVDENYSVLPHSSCAVSNPIRNKRYDAMLNFHNALIPDFAGLPAHADLRTGPVAMACQPNADIAYTQAPWDAGECLTLQVLDFSDSGSFQLHFEFNVDVFDDAASKRAVEHFVNLLDAMLANPDCGVNAAAMLTVGELKEITPDMPSLTESARESFDERTVLERFRDWVVREPERQALLQGPSSDRTGLCYGELDDRVRILGAAIREAGIAREDRVAICLTRSADLLVALLATHDASAAYVPIDPDQPAARIALILEEARPSLVITEPALVECVQTNDVPLMLLEPSMWDAAPPTPAESTPEQSDEPGSPLAYVIFTSGSTGRPKGVEIEHHALSNLMTSMAHTPGLSKTDRLLAVTTISFDISALELFLPLTIGACLDIADEETCRDPIKLSERLDASRITVMQATPASWQMLVDSGWTGRSELRVFCGGDALSRELANELLDRSLEVWNLYGPTETTIWSAVARVEAGEQAICIGRPIDRTSLRILSSGLGPVPRGVPGELFIAGDGLARGYCRRRDLTAERFLVTPEDPDLLFYRTGDRVRQWPDGSIECLGRVDFQVKIRGFRIELGEIEAALRRMDDVAEAVVTARGEGARARHLVATLVARKGTELVIETLSSSLRGELPVYMIPAHWMIVDRLPLTSNGKIDRKRVEALSGPKTRVVRSWEEPRDDTEVQIAEIWRDLLDRQIATDADTDDVAELGDVGRNDDFFDLGGNSLLAVECLARIDLRLGRRIALARFFDQPTLAGLSDALSSDGGSTHFTTAVELRAGSGETPIFCIGGIHLYQRLAREMKPTRQVFGIFLAREAEWISALERGQSPKLAATEETAAGYIDVIKRCQPEGPYRLAGLSYGGVLAYEIARQLSDAGHRVEALILLDVGLEGALARAAGFVSRIRHRIRRWRSDWAGRKVLRDLRRDPAEIRDQLFIEAIRGYEERIEGYDGSVLLCRAKDNIRDHRDADPSLGWADLVRGELTIVECPGDHVGLIAGENAGPTAELIERYLASIESGCD